MQRIELPLFDLKYNIIHKDLPHTHSICLMHTFLSYHLNAYIDELPKKEDGEYEVKAQQYFDSKTMIPKDKICSVSSFYDNEHEVYVLEIKSCTEDICPKFETVEQLNSVQSVITEWMCEKG